MNKIIIHISRCLLGIVFFIAGLNGYFVIFHFEPFIPTSSKVMAIFEFKYLLVFEKSLEIICGVLLLLNRFVPLALVILSPIVVNILLFHLFLDYSLLLIAILLFIMNIYMLFAYRKNFVSLLEKK
ncbi:hypothetical protein BAMA_04090 [Bacillus manliponensis]|uniref:DoxX family protein n=1 Tax=Bacillus manliponensis TaxID=574376 RepID=A0A073JUG5_9BACI|nr:hypothetical protein [Bacillus manliponensis]KEK18694.1 hypothetical protein BAMA_04090 [Bacillus manliponensis]